MAKDRLINDEPALLALRVRTAYLRSAGGAARSTLFLNLYSLCESCLPRIDLFNPLILLGVRGRSVL